MTRHFHCILNPKSGTGSNIQLIGQFRDFLISKDCHLKITPTQSLEHAGQLAQLALNDRADGLIIAGGDGTVRCVAKSIRDSGLPIFLIPCGTENLLAGELGIEANWPCLQRCFEHGMTRQIDMGRVNGEEFLAVLGVGFDAEVVRLVHNNRTGHISQLDYVWPICRTFWEYDFPHTRVEADGELLCNEPALVFVGNISRYAVELPILVGADCSDGLLDLCIFKCRNRLELLKHATLTVLHQSDRSDRVLRRRCCHIRIDSSDTNAAVEMDGDPGPTMPLEITLTPAVINIITPPPPPGQKYAGPVRYYHLKKLLS